MTKGKHPLVFDGHNDTVLKLYLQDQPSDPPKETPEADRIDFFRRNNSGHLDLVRAQEGGFGGGFFAIFIPGEQPMDKSRLEETEDGFRYPLDDPIDTGRARRMTLEIIEHTLRLERQAEGRFRVVRRVPEIRECFESGAMAAIIHFEGAEALGRDTSSLFEYYQLGLRSLGLVWSRPNAFATGVPFEFPSSPDIGPGLTDQGRELVRACNELGILIDLSHLNEKGFWDVAKLSEHPLVPTHSCVHALCPTPRNLTDAQLDAVRDTNGVVGINFAVSFLRADGRSDAQTPLADLTRHINYVAERIGVDHVALGSDFDGTKVPQPIGDASGLPRIFDALQEDGWSHGDLSKLAHENWLRVLEATWKD